MSLHSGGEKTRKINLPAELGCLSTSLPLGPLPATSSLREGFTDLPSFCWQFYPRHILLAYLCWCSSPEAPVAAAPCQPNPLPAGALSTLPQQVTSPLPAPLFTSRCPAHSSSLSIYQQVSSPLYQQVPGPLWHSHSSLAGAQPTLQAPLFTSRCPDYPAAAHSSSRPVVSPRTSFSPVDARGPRAEGWGCPGQYLPQVNARRAVGPIVSLMSRLSTIFIMSTLSTLSSRQFMKIHDNLGQFVTICDLGSHWFTWAHYSSLGFT